MAGPKKILDSPETAFVRFCREFRDRDRSVSMMTHMLRNNIHKSRVFSAFWAVCILAGANHLEQRITGIIPEPASIDGRTIVT